MNGYHGCLSKSVLFMFFLAASGCAIQPGAGGSQPLPPLPAGVNAYGYNNNSLIPIAGGYTVINNEWNLQAATGGSETIFADTNSSGAVFFGWQWNWGNSTTYNVIAYPEIFYGSSPWSSTHTAGFPFSITGHTVTSSFNISMETLQILNWDTYDTAYDIWIISNTSNPLSFSAGDIKCELMIWLSSLNAIPDGLSPSGSMTANGYAFNYYYHPGQSSGTAYSWIYAAFSAGPAVQIFNESSFNITPFLDYLTNIGVLNPGDYVCTVELGTEVAIGQGMTVISNYSVTVQ